MVVGSEGWVESVSGRLASSNVILTFNPNQTRAKLFRVIGRGLFMLEGCNDMGIHRHGDRSIRATATLQFLPRFSEDRRVGRIINSRQDPRFDTPAADSKTSHLQLLRVG